jgi:hypothetical protein
MLRAIAFSMGLFVALCGSSFLMVDKMVLTMKLDPKPAPEPVRSEEFRGLFIEKDEHDNSVFNPPEWVAFCLMSVGTVTMLYSVALPKKKKGEG